VSAPDDEPEPLDPLAVPPPLESTEPAAFPTWVPDEETPEPTWEVAEPTCEVAEPTWEVAEPTWEVAEPTWEVAEPTWEVAEPTRDVTVPIGSSGPPAAAPLAERPHSASSPNSRDRIAADRIETPIRPYPRTP
jgi:hypothetical protein